MAFDRYILLVYKKMKGELSTAESSELKDLANSNPEYTRSEKELEGVWDISKDTLPPIQEPDTISSFAQLQQKINSSQQNATAKPSSVPVNWVLFAKIAAILTGVVAAFYLLMNYNDDYTTYATTKDEKKEIPLPNGGAVWLNENSLLKVYDIKDSDDWVFELDGEALFDFYTTTGNPVFVKDKYSLITVHGTVFNLRCKAGEHLSCLSVQKGNVLVEAHSSGNAKRLEVKANQKYVYDSHNDQSLITDDINLNDLAWQRNYLIFKDTPLAQVVKEVEEQLELNIISYPEELLSCLVTGRYNLQSDKELILQGIAEIFEMDVQQKGTSQFIFSGGRPCN